MCLMSGNMFLRILLLSLPLGCSITVPTGTFTAKCHDRHFWLSVKASFLGSTVQFNIEGVQFKTVACLWSCADHRTALGQISFGWLTILKLCAGIHVLSSQRAAECGYTVVLNHRGDLVLRASYLACYVDNRKDTEFRLQVQFINRQANGSLVTYPLKLFCSLTQPWSPREIVCEENYREVSIQWHFPVVSDKGVTGPDLHSKASEDRGEQLHLGHVVFYGPDNVHSVYFSIKEAESLGYHITATATRILLRSAYSSPFSYMLKEQVEGVHALIFVQLERMSVPVEISVACTKTEALVDGLHLLWSFPLTFSPLVQSGFSNGGMKMEVGGRMLYDCDFHESGYEATLKKQTVVIRIPFKRDGAQLKSAVIKGQYAQALAVDLFYMHHWEDVLWLHTQLRIFRQLRTQYVPETPTLTNNTGTSASMFSVTLGVFPADVRLLHVAVGNDTLTWTEAQHQGLHLTQVFFGNGSHAYALKVPFSHPMVTQKVISGHYRRHTLALTFVFIILPEKEHYSYSTDVVSDIKEPAVPAKLEGNCTESGIVVVLHYGSEDVQWELYVGRHTLNWDLVELGGYKVNKEDDHMSVEIPLYSPGMTYEDFSLEDVVAKVEVSAADAVTLEVEHTLVQRCKFPVRDLLVCLPKGRMVVVADTTRSIPPTSPNSTTLLDPSCTPVATDSARVLFNFSVDSCGTTMTVEDEYLLYENQIRVAQKLLPEEDPLIRVDSPYRLTLQCRYPIKNPRTLTLHPLHNATSEHPPLPWKQT